MDANTLNAITDVAQLRAIIAQQAAQIAQRDRSIEERDVRIAQRDASIEQRDRIIEQRDQKISRLTLELSRLRRLQFAATSERLDPDQRSLFDQTMAADIAAVEAELAALQPAAQGNADTRRPSRRQPLPSALPRQQTVHAPAACDCPDCGTALVKIGEHVSETLDVVPAKYFVQRDVYPQYSCKACQRIVAEPVQPRLIERGIAAPGLLAQVVIDKYTDHLPLYRQEAIFARHGVTLSRTTLAEWIGAVGVHLQPLVDRLTERLLQAPVLHADETPVQQLDPGAGKTRRAYLFVYRSTGSDPIVLFDYCRSRSGKHAQAFLHHWQGALMVDDYAGYKGLFGTGILELGCWAHARRLFFDAHKASTSPVAEQALQHIQGLYQIEAKLRDLDETQRLDHRQQHLAPRLHAFKQWLDDLHPKVLGNSGVHKAITYTLRRWPALVRVLDNGAYPFDNNPVENAIRPIAVGRKNWLFAGSEPAGKRAAAIMSLLATAKANGIQPHAWLRDVLTRLPTTLDRDIDTLLPLPQCWTPMQGAVG